MGAISESLFESELFGHERGSLPMPTRADRESLKRHPAVPLFMDEIGNLP